MTPTTKRRLHAGLTLLWVLLLVPGVLFWRQSITFLVLVSIYANVAGHWAAYEASTPMEIVKKDQPLNTKGGEHGSSKEDYQEGSA